MAQYDNFAERYIEARNKGFSPNKHIEMPTMFRIIGKIRNKRLLDVGCGFGVHAQFYSKKGAKVIGIDESKRELEYARSLKMKNTQFLLHNINKRFPFKNNKFDIVTCSLVLDHIKDIKRVFKECYRVLKKKGVMIFSVTNPILHQENRIAGELKKGNRKRIFGDYFKRRKIKHKWRRIMDVEWYHKPLEDYINSFLKAGFNLLEFKEAKPIPSSKKLNSTYYKFVSRNPYFLFFKITKH